MRANPAANTNLIIDNRKVHSSFLLSQANCLNVAFISANTAAHAVFRLQMWEEVTRVGGRNLLYIDHAENLAAAATAVAEICRFVQHIITQVN